jgi:hypothetical protein
MPDDGLWQGLKHVALLTQQWKDYVQQQYT